MTMYRVTATLSQRELIDYLDANGSIEVKIEVIANDGAAEEGSPGLPRAPRPLPTVQRRKRSSKVNDTILDRLRRGPAEAIALRTSLEDAGLSPNSLSTGLALLQKDGLVRRDADGSYSLADAA